jgi:hypothetical protein
MGSTRQRPVSLNDISDLSLTHDDDHDNDYDNDEDDTARIDKRHSNRSSSENAMALQRVKSLAQRNRMVSIFF